MIKCFFQVNVGNVKAEMKKSDYFRFEVGTKIKRLSLLSNSKASVYGLKDRILSDFADMNISDQCHILNLEEKVFGKKN